MYGIILFEITCLIKSILLSSIFVHFTYSYQSCVFKIFGEYTPTDVNLVTVMGRCSCDAIEHSIKLSLTYVFSHVGLCTCVVGYSIAGAFLFQWLEENYQWQTYSVSRHSETCMDLSLIHI